MFAVVMAALAFASYWTVHIDYPSNRAEFERIDSQFRATIHDFYAAHNLSEPTVWSVVTADGAYFGLRPRGTLADVAAPMLAPDLSKELQARTAPISAATHKTLRAHHNELWHLQPDLTTRKEDPMPRRYSIMRIDVVDPPRDDDYEAAMNQIVRELSANGVETLAFFSSYGDGDYHYIFSSEKPIHVPALQGFGKTRDVAIKRLEIR